MSPTTTQPDQPEPTEADTAAGAALLTLVAAQAAARARFTKQAVAIASESAAGFTGWYDTAQITDWATKLAARIEPLQRALAQTTDAYLARALSSLLGGRTRPVGRVDVTSLRQGITHAGAYGRAADVYRYQQSQFDAFAHDLADAADPAGLSPVDIVDPIDAAVERVKAVADMDMQLADRAQSQQVLVERETRADITGYRRVVHPELSKGGTCGLCIAASHRIYHVKDLRAVHGRCECTSLPIVGSLDPGSGLNNLDLQTLYQHAGGTTAAQALKRTRYKIDEHGELGWVLTSGGKTRTADQAKRDTNRPPRRPATAEERRASIDRVLARSIGAQDKAHALATADPKKWGPYAAQLDARIADLRRQIAVPL